MGEISTSYLSLESGEEVAAVAIALRPGFTTISPEPINQHGPSS
jgi:hypothetical protein